ncbi:MAG: coproporphyrinogen III oxidase family protein [Chloroflexi bacterium]|nr:coproporphyrinogen III oxidase family protein [Chloroflexota bacterium]
MGQNWGHRQDERLLKSLANFTGLVTRREGRKFLQLNQEFDAQAVKTSQASGNDCSSLYIHIPFCRTLCPFCCFNRYLLSEDKARQYFQNLRKEVAFYSQRGFRFSNFYFGGGTPTVAIDELISFINFLKENFEVKQISLETTHREINRQNIDLLKAAGINRLSIGVQSFDNNILKTMGRATETGEEAREKLSMAQGHFDTVNADFIFNFPGQSIEQFADDIATFKALGIDQATFYPLMPSPHKMSALERRFQWVDTSREKDFYDVILSELYQTDYRVSTVWCFSRGDRIIDEYIIDDDDYIGVGAGSVSFLKGAFYVNTFSLEKYDQIISSNRLPIVRWKNLSEREHLRYYLLTKLFGTTLDREKFYRRFNDDVNKKLRFELLFFRLFGLIRDNGKISLTRKGMYLTSVMMKEFFAALNGLREYCIENKI